MSHLLLVDASGFAFRAYATAFPAYRESDGEPIGAVLAFMGMLWRMRGAAQADQPTHGAAVFDSPGGRYFRHDIFPAYKSNRPAARPVELDNQLPVMRLAADALGLKPVEKENYEADDVIATLARRGREAGMRVTIVSSDKDFGQLVEDGAIEIVDQLQKRRILEADIERKFGVMPKWVADVQALAGDAVDHIPGVDGCGLKRAAALIRRFGHLEAVLGNIKGIHWPQAQSYLRRKHSYPGIEGSRTGADWARLFLTLTTLRQDVDVNVTLEELTLQPVMRRHLVEILRLLEAPAHMEAVFALDPKAQRIMPALTGPGQAWEWWEEELAHPGQKIPDVPQCGFYKRRLVQGGPEVAARIWREMERGEGDVATGMDILRCEVAGKLRDPYGEWVRLSMKPIKEAEFNYMTANTAHAKKWRPDDPAANPEKKIDITKAPAPLGPGSKKRRQYDER